jgi:hypothetical protein
MALFHAHWKGSVSSNRMTVPTVLNTNAPIVIMAGNWSNIPN